MIKNNSEVNSCPLFHFHIIFFFGESIFLHKINHLLVSLLQDLIGDGNLFFMFGGVALLSLVFIFFKIPETKGLTLEEIEAKLL